MLVPESAWTHFVFFFCFLPFLCVVSHTKKSQEEGWNAIKRKFNCWQRNYPAWSTQVCFLAPPFPDSPHTCGCACLGVIANVCVRAACAVLLGFKAEMALPLKAAHMTKYHWETVCGGGVLGHDISSLRWKQLCCGNGNQTLPYLLVCMCVFCFCLFTFSSVIRMFWLFSSYFQLVHFGAKSVYWLFRVFYLMLKNWKWICPKRL